MQYLRELASARELLANLTLRDIRGQYKRTILGRLWSLVSPLSSMLVYSFVFYFLLRAEPAAGDPSGLHIFAVWLLCGLLPWSFFSGALSASMSSIVGGAGLITKVYFPRVVLPVSAVLTTGYNWLFEMAVLVIVLCAVGGWGVIVWLPLVAVFMVVLAAFAVGVGMLLAIANVYFRDTQHLISILLQIWMYLTPIIYPASLVGVQSDKVGGLLGTPITVMDIYESNPMFHFVQVFRNLMYDQRWPDPADVLACLAWALVALVAGFLVFTRKEKRLAEIL
ncbi:ABC transporter permease [Plantibacter sp. VKM Ac-2885]|uniref:ABC transporter permease n=1 Tax=Plantibacter TaxID=190323 RepID=UPI0010C1C1A2|nr:MULTISPECIES: ABC transporter permease [Plantibacter]MBD8103567.1 ABC transporter permease [Plantibacter sp. CFBP 8775]MBD8516579.1 ABC transporter permease [Plantibacter sp. CFBP 8804]MBF4514382.1 ABC transporter permease [Plantibacter sp. VKM Ac-2885]TKJ96527.1 ABC transporter permease [Plantibacter flavus]